MSMINEQLYNAANVIDNALNQYKTDFSAFKNKLKKLTKKGINSEQFRNYRLNYFYRTSTTLSMIEALVKSISLNPNVSPSTLSFVTETYRDELGESTNGKSHKELLEFAYNIHGRIVFGLEQENIDVPSDAKNLLRASKKYRDIQAMLYTSDKIPEALGAFLAQESAAQSMLVLFYEVFFLPFKEKYTGAEYRFEDVTLYFTAHICGVEEEHAERARQCALNECKTLNDLMLLKSSIDSFNKAQLNLWDSLFLDIRSQEVRLEVAF